jgi:hypothetical protein
MTEQRSAIESLRSGVPSLHATARLGTTQDELKERFEAELSNLSEGKKVSPIVISANFGGGKSHLLHYFQTVAERNNFVTSYLVVSPEMPLGSPHVVLKALAENAIAPGRTGRALKELMADFRAGSAPEYADLRLWGRDSGIRDRFNALLLLYEEIRGDEELLDQILQDFEGLSAVPKTTIRRHLKDLGQTAGYDLTSSKQALLAHDRIRMLAQLFRMRTGKGWVILFDELERMTTFSKKQRLPAYDQLGWWSEIANQPGSAILPVFAMTTGFMQETVVGGKNDADLLQTPTIDFLPYAKLGIDLLKSAILLSSPTPEQERQILYRLKSLYQEAYNGIELPDLPNAPQRVRTSIRSEIRRWITLWDLHRYDPDYHVEIQEEELPSDTREVPEDIIAGSDGEADEE